MKQMLLDVFGNKDAMATLLFCISALVGQVLHTVKKWADGEVSSVFAWLGSNARRTVGAAIGNIAGMLIFVQTGVLGPLMALPNGAWVLFLFGFMQGFSIDSGLNKGMRDEWTAEQRAAAGKT